MAQKNRVQIFCRAVLHVFQVIFCRVQLLVTTQPRYKGIEVYKQLFEILKVSNESENEQKRVKV